MTSPHIAPRMPRISGGVDPIVKTYLDRLASEIEQSLTNLGSNMTVPGTEFSGLPASPSYTSDAAAAAGGVLVGHWYRNGSALQVRIV